MAVEPEDVYGRILARAERSELETQCRAVVERDASGVSRRIKQAAVVLARIREIESAAGQLKQKQSLRGSKTNCDHIADIRELQQQISATLWRIVNMEGLPKLETQSASAKQDKLHKQPKVVTEEPTHSFSNVIKSKSSLSKRKKRRRTGSNEIVSSPALSLSYEQQLVKLYHVQQFAAVAPPNSVSVCPMGVPIAEPCSIIDMIGDGSGESPIELELMESDSEAGSPTCHDSAVELQKASTSVQLTQFPLLVQRFASYLDSPVDESVEETFVRAVEIAIDIALCLPLSDSTRAAPRDLMAVFERLKASSVPLSGSLTRRATELLEYSVQDISNAGDGRLLEASNHDELVVRVHV